MDEGSTGRRGIHRAAVGNRAESDDLLQDVAVVLCGVPRRTTVARRSLAGRSALPVTRFWPTTAGAVDRLFFEKMKPSGQVAAA